MISHPDKVLFPDDGITKGEVAAYYATVAPLMLPHLRGRPVTMERYPNGIGAGGFLQKDVSKGFPEWLQRVEAPKRGGVVHYPLIDDARSLEWLANQNCVTPHVWASRAPKLYEPDVFVVDLDPSAEDELDNLRGAALLVRDVLGELNLPCWVKTSGSKGFHIVVPLDAALGFDEVSAFTQRVARVLVERDPEHLTIEFSKAERGGRIYVDVGRNGYSATFAAASPASQAGAPVSAPCTWDEVEGGEVGPQTFSLRSMPARIEAVGDLWADMPKHGRSLRKAMSRLRA